MVKKYQYGVQIKDIVCRYETMVQDMCKYSEDIEKYHS